MGIHYHDNCFCFQCYEDLHAPSTVHYEDIISVQAKPSLIHIRDDAPPAPETADDGTTTQPATLAFLSSWQPLEGADTPRPAVRKTENSVHHFCTMTGDVQLPDHLRGTWRRYHVPSKYNSVEAPIPEVSLGWQAETIFLHLSFTVYTCTLFIINLTPVITSTIWKINCVCMDQCKTAVSGVH